MGNWQNTPEKRRRDSQVYGAEWRRQRQRALERAGRRCEQCRSAIRVQVDHKVPVSQGGTHHLDNLQVLCEGCHKAKTATEGGGYRSRSSRQQADPDPRPTTAW